MKVLSFPFIPFIVLFFYFIFLFSLEKETHSNFISIIKANKVAVEEDMILYSICLKQIREDKWKD